MKGKRKIISILLILALFCCSCGKENTAGETVESEQNVDEPTVEDSTAEEPEEMPAIVFLLRDEFYRGHREELPYLPQFYVSFFDNQGNLYSLQDSYVDEFTDKELYDEFAEGKLDAYLSLDTTCELDELRENYELLKSVAENEELRFVPDRDMESWYLPGFWGGDICSWSAFYYNEDGNLSWIEFRNSPDYPQGITYKADDERADQIYEWFVSVSEMWR